MLTQLKTEKEKKLWRRQFASKIESSVMGYKLYWSKPLGPDIAPLHWSVSLMLS